jgi:hypothetical protein
MNTEFCNVYLLTDRAQNAPVSNDGKVGVPGISNLRTIRRFVEVLHVPATLLALRILSYIRNLFTFIYDFSICSCWKEI